MRIRINDAEMRDLLSGPAGPVVREVEKYTRRTETEAKRRSPVNDGDLRASIQSELSSGGDRVVGTVFSPLDYAIWQHEGTGVYAGNGPITPKSGDFLVFRPKQRHPQGPGKRGGKGGLVFARSVKGTPPNPFLESALRDVVPWPVTRLT